MGLGSVLCVSWARYFYPYFLAGVSAFDGLALDPINKLNNPKVGVFFNGCRGYIYFNYFDFHT